MSSIHVHRGQRNTLSYRVYFRNGAGEIISPFHDIPLLADKEKQIYNAVIEIPRWSNAKMEINKKEKFNPISQDVKNGKLRYVNNVFPYHGYIWNYGALPQTWEDPNEKDETTGFNGDNDPLDVCEIGSRVHSRGALVQVKVLGALGLIDEGEADWKIIAIDVTDPLAAELNDIADVEKRMPGLLEATRDWFRIYKIPTGKPPNIFAESGKFFDRGFALKQIEHDHSQWSALMRGHYEATPEKQKGISLAHTSALEGVKSGRMSGDEARKAVEAESEEHKNEHAHVDALPIDTVHFVDRTKV